MLKAILALTAITSVKLPFVQIEDDYKVGYTPRNARAMREIKIHQEFTKGDTMSTILILTASDGGSMARIEHLNETVRILDEINTGFKVKNLSFSDFCDNFCSANEPVVLFRNGILMLQRDRHHSLNETEGAFHNNFNLSFPIMSIFGKGLDLSRNFYGVETYAPGHTPIDAATNIESLKVVALIFRAVRPAAWTVRDANLWDESIRSHYLEGDNGSKYVRAHPYSIPYLESEISRTSKSISPYIAPGFVLMCIFSTVTIYLQASKHSQWPLDKLVYGIVACITPLLAAGSALGLIAWFGVRFASILLLTPFLVLSIGVDDAYIVMNSWERLRSGKSHRQPPSDSLRDRISELWSVAAPLISKFVPINVRVQLQLSDF